MVSGQNDRIAEAASTSLSYTHSVWPSTWITSLAENCLLCDIHPSLLYDIQSLGSDQYSKVPKVEIEI